MKRERIFLVIIAVFVILLLNVKSWAAEYSMKSGEISREGLSASCAQAYFAKRVDEITKGKVKVNIFYGGTIGSERNCC